MYGIHIYTIQWAVHAVSLGWARSLSSHRCPVNLGGCKNRTELDRRPSFRYSREGFTPRMHLDVVITRRTPGTVFSDLCPINK